MRKEPFEVGDYLHVYNCGNRKMTIFQKESDYWRFLKSLRYFNNQDSQENVFRELDFLIKSGGGKNFEWSKSWPAQKPLVKILAYCLMPNHFHLLLKEIIKGGVTGFMRKLGTGFTNYVNIKYGETGRVFQGSYKSKTLTDVRYLQYLDAYIQALNPFELYPGGIEKSLKEFDKAFEFALNYPFSSLDESFEKRKIFVIERDVLEELFTNLKIYKEFTYDALIVRNAREILGKLAID